MDKGRTNDDTELGKNGYHSAIRGREGKTSMAEVEPSEEIQWWQIPEVEAYLRQQWGYREVSPRGIMCFCLYSIMD